MRRSSFTIALYLALVFLSGLIVGAYGYRFLTNSPVTAATRKKPSPEEWRSQYLSEMRTRLKMTPDQLQKLNALMDETRERFHSERQKHDGVMKTIRDEQTDKVRAMLTEAQRPEYEKLRTEREQRAKAAGTNTH